VRAKYGVHGPLTRRTYVEVVATGVLVCAVAYYTGRALADYQVRTFGLGHGTTFAITVIAIVAMALLRAASFAGFVAIATLAVMNGLPFVDVDSFSVPGSFRVSDVAVVALMIVLGTRQEIHDRAAARAVEIARGWGIALVLWWTFTWARSVFAGIPAVDAALFGRDFLYFAILLPLAVGAFARRKDIFTFLSVLAIATLIYAVAQLGVTALGLDRYGVIGLFIHEIFTNELGGLHRVYAHMTDPVNVALPLGVGLALIGRRRSLRLVGAGIAIVTTLSILFSFTRATYLGLTFAFLLTSVLWLGQSSRGSYALRRLSFAALAAVLVVIVSGAYRPLLYSNQATETAAERAATAIADLQHRRGTVQYRYDLQKEMRGVLGSDWIAGLGFLHPDAHYVPGLPSGSIRNSDVGVLSSVMTMGVIGTVLLYGPPLAILFLIFRFRRRRSQTVAAHEWFFYGIAVWLIYVLVTSLSLVTLFSVPGLVLTSLLLGCTARLLIEDVRGEWSPS
jgi:hypothetical protein